MDLEIAKTIQEDLINGTLKSHCLQVIYELKIHEILNQNGGFMSSVDICKKIESKNIKPGYLQRLLRYMACFDVVEERMNGKDVVFKATEVLKVHEITRGFLFTCLSPHLMELLDVSTGEKPLFEHVCGCTIWNYMENKTNEHFKNIFTNTMEYLSAEVVRDVSKISGVIKNAMKESGVIIDVGGGSGYMMEALKKELPHWDCINFDLPYVTERNRPLPGVEMVAGDMFKVGSIPKCDVILTKNISNDWSDAKCIEMMRNFHSALNDDGMLLSVNYFMPAPEDENRSWKIRSMDVNMMMVFGEARERTYAEFEDLHREAGFRLNKYVLIGPEDRQCGLLVATKSNLNYRQKH
ncbi:uncharacterized protein LOC130644337 [Hydractinia symbiolongicarpus]|uniref:uncharacterized protein LOC130644337 n=1 Tax=Hydractinia symbiolongicarpus TaxID=13093 RepID=UPI00254B9882|nr:uncharacterized protein LOC130644337 [Hydractinia symbiolongicarpus]